MRKERDLLVSRVAEEFPNGRVLPPSSPLPHDGLHSVQHSSILAESSTVQVFLCRREALQEFTLFAFIEAEEGPARTSPHSPLKHHVFGKTPENWHTFDHSLFGQVAKVKLVVNDLDSGEVQSITVTPISTTEACADWIKWRMQNIGACMSATPRDLQALLVEVEKSVNGHESGAVSLLDALNIVLYFREWEEEFREKLRRDLKLTYQREKRRCKEAGLDLPEMPDYQQILSSHKNDLMENLAVTFTDMLQDIQQAIDLCAERLDTEAVASMLSSIYTQVNIN